MTAEELVLTIAICTRNRATLLERAVRSILDQSNESSVEVLVIDNGSTDGTRQLLEYLAQSDSRLRYVREDTTGLAHARNRAYQEARGKYVGYLDDDAIAPAMWLDTATAIISQHLPQFFGGPYFAHFDSPPPKWYDPRFGSYEPSRDAGVLPEDAYLPGANFFVRRDVLFELGGFDTNLGMRGEQIGYGEEVDLLTRGRKRFGAGCAYYDPDLFVYHRVAPQKLIFRVYAYQRFVNGRDLGRRETVRAPGLGRVVLRTGRSLFGLSVVGLEVMVRNKQLFPSPVAFAAGRALTMIWNLGHTYGTLTTRRR